jgi:hypothetical protein
MVGNEQGGFGGDWSIGLNSASAHTLADIEVLARFGVGLCALYKDVLREPVRIISLPWSTSSRSLFRRRGQKPRDDVPAHCQSMDPSRQYLTEVTAEVASPLPRRKGGHDLVARSSVPIAAFLPHLPRKPRHCRSGRPHVAAGPLTKIGIAR